MTDHSKFCTCTRCREDRSTDRIRAAYARGMPILEISKLTGLSTYAVMRVVLASRPKIQGGQGTGL